MENEDYQAHGRCYRNQKQDGYIAEVYMGGKEYREVYLDDRFKAISFFGLTESGIGVKIANTVEVHLIYFLNIDLVKPGILHRADEEVRKDVQALVDTPIFGFTLTGIELGIDRVFQEYAGTILASRANLNGLKFRDMHPYHCFRFDFDLTYNIKQC